MNTNYYTIRFEKEEDYGEVENLVRESFWNVYEKPKYKILTNFSPYKEDRTSHPWMGWDRYQKAEELLEGTGDDFDVDDCFRVLREVSQTVCPTEVSMVFDAGERIVYWCEHRQWENRKQYQLKKD